MHTLLEDVRFAVRGLARSSGFTTMAMFTLALGIAVNATMFSVVDGILLQPLGYREAGRLVAISAYINGSQVPMAFPELFDLRDQAKSFEDVAGDKTVTGNITGVDEPERIEVRGVTGSFFAMLGADALLGRAFTKADEVPGIAPIGVISYGLWQRRFGGDRSAIGRTVRIDDDDYTIVGVMPPGFDHPAADPARPIDFWFPSGFRATPFPPLTRQWRVANVFARLAPGVTIERAQDELRRLAQEWRATYPLSHIHISEPTRH
jgi:putative ABC transport system permease protein